MPARNYTVTCFLLLTCIVLRAGDSKAEPFTVSVYPTVDADYRTIQAAIDEVPPGSEIVLLDTHIQRSGCSNLFVPNKGLTIRSKQEYPNNTIIYCYSWKPYTGEKIRYRGVTFEAGVGPDTVLEGIRFLGAGAKSGAGMLCNGSSPTLRKCEFLDCVATGKGGGIYVTGGGRPILDRVVVKGCSASSGGALACDSNSGAVLENCTLWSNHTYSLEGGAIDIGVSTDIDLSYSVVGTDNPGEFCVTGFGYESGIWPGDDPVEFDNSIVFNYQHPGWLSSQFSPVNLDGRPNPRANRTIDPDLSMHLSPYVSSPCVPTGAAGSVPQGMKVPVRKGRDAEPDPRCRYIGAREIVGELVRADGSCRCSTIQEAVDLMEDEPEHRSLILLSEGTYAGPGNGDIVVPGNGKTKITGFAGAGRTILEGDLTVPAFRGDDDHSPSLRLSGLTIRGFARALVGNSLSLEVRNCVFEGNVADGNGGAVHAGDPWLETALYFSKCRFIGNQANGIYSLGGAVYSLAAKIAFHYCVFLGNEANLNGGAVASVGTTTIGHCIFWGNRAEYGGGAVYAWLTSPDYLQISDSVLAHNLGGAFRASESSVLGRVHDNIFHANLIGCEFSDTAIEMDWLWQEPELGNVHLAPGFCDPYEGDFRLRDGAPAVLAGFFDAWPLPSDWDLWPEPCEVPWDLDDWDGDGVPDAEMLVDHPELDCDGNGLWDAMEIATGQAIDCDGDGLPRTCDPDDVD